MKLLRLPALRRLNDKLAAMSARDRAALLVAGLSLVACVEWWVVWPMHVKRDAIVGAARAEVQATAEAAAQAEQGRRDASTALQARETALAADLAGLGITGSSQRPLRELVANSLRPQDVQLLAVRSLGVEAVDASASRLGNAQPGTQTGAAPEPPGDPTASALYRHRFEIRLAGEPSALLDAAAALERDLRPLRAEVLRLSGGGPRRVELTLALAVIATERVWLSI